jgi:hypothetical protein
MRTNIAGILKFLIIIVAAGLVYFSKATLTEATAFAVGAGGVISGWGFLKAKDDNSTNPTTPIQ